MTKILGRLARLALVASASLAFIQAQAQSCRHEYHRPGGVCIATVLLDRRKVKSCSSQVVRRFAPGL